MVWYKTIMGRTRRKSARRTRRVSRRASVRRASRSRSVRRRPRRTRRKSRRMKGGTSGIWEKGDTCYLCHKRVYHVLGTATAGLFKRRHHCIECGRTVCGKDSKKRTHGRLCTTCYTRGIREVKRDEMGSPITDIDHGGEGNQTLPSAAS